MPLARIEDSILYFAHIPKTGGSSIEAYIKAKGALSLYHKTAVGGLKTSPQHLQVELFDKIVPRAFYDHGFTVLRDPVARLVSEFCYRARPPARVWFRQADGLARLPIRGKGRNLTFDQWVNTIFEVYLENSYVSGNHIRPQVDFVHPDHLCFRFEAGLDQVLRWIDEVTQTAPLHSERLNKARWPKPEVSPALRRKIETFYARDYELLDRLQTAGTPLTGRELLEDMYPLQPGPAAFSERMHHR